MMTFGTLTRTDDAQVITFDRLLRHPRTKVWAALTEPEQRAVWLFAGSLPLTVGGRVELTDSAVGITGTVTEAVMGTILEFTWTSLDAPESVVRFELSDHADGTRLVLTHTVLAGNPENLMPGWHRIIVDDLPEFLEDGAVSDKPGRFDSLREEHYLPLVGSTR